jgi:CheY-like chemotaxis protein
LAKGSRAHAALVLDDEPEYLAWVKEYLANKGLSTVFARTLAEAMEIIAKQDFRLLLVDMNVPIDPSVEPRFQRDMPLVSKYPGLALAMEARNMGYGAHSVIAYTVHDDDAIDAALRLLNCRYVLKGRPNVLKRVIDSSLAPTPKSAP